MTRAQAQRSPRDTLGEAKDKRQNQRTKAAACKEQKAREGGGLLCHYEIRDTAAAADKAPPLLSPILDYTEQKI